MKQQYFVYRYKEYTLIRRGKKYRRFQEDIHIHWWKCRPDEFDHHVRHNTFKLLGKFNTYQESLQYAECITLLGI